MDKKKEDGNSIFSATRFKQVLIVIFATIAFLMTAYATSGGVRMFLTESYAWVGITALAVGFLAFTSVVLGDGISTARMSRVALVMPFYLIAVAICWISSFASYHQQFLSVGGSDLANAETSLRQLGLYTYEINNDIKDRYASDRKALLSEDSLTEYSERMVKLAGELRDRETQKEIKVELAALIENRIEELRSREVELKNAQNDLQEEILRLAPQIESLATDALEKQAKWTQMETLIGDLETALRSEEGDTSLPLGSRGVLEANSLAGQLVDDPACKRRRRVGTGGGIVGTCFNAIGEKLTETRALAQQDKAAYEDSLREVQTARQQRAGLQERIAALDEELKATEVGDAESMAADYTLDTDGFLQSVDDYVDNPSQATFRQTAEYCLGVTDALAGLKTISDIPECEPQTVMAVFRQIEVLEASNAQYEFACEETDRRKEVVETLRADIDGLTGVNRLEPISRAYDVMRSEVLEQCIVAAEQRGLDMTPYRQDISDLVDRINPTQDPISAAMGKIQSLFSGTASARDYFPALLALLQELSLLLSKLFWDASVMAKSAKRKDEIDISELDLNAKPDDPDAILAAKNIILNAVFDRRGYQLPALYDEEYSHEMRNQMRLIVDTLIRKGLAKKSGQEIAISEAGMSEIGWRIRRYNETVDGGVANPSTTTNANVAPPVEQQAKPATDQRQDPTLTESDENAATSGSESDPVAGEGATLDTSQVSEEEATQRQRRRRPVVVRPNFRREV